ncbi:hypothetical protein W911_14970 [Hyphomicrobium nitrativorans NL23]|uniref:Uncharacterized protein n=1 Tax=Hyphomicrobium nitrativorans NL23 TaxID=1029756 RepID=V5SIK9_9HYPH|nr:hypothetical protein W911_14970 [Hyphomicrobium nitrativorans NL23]
MLRGLSGFSGETGRASSGEWRDKPTGLGARLSSSLGGTGKARAVEAAGANLRRRPSEGLPLS